MMREKVSRATARKPVPKERVQKGRSVAGELSMLPPDHHQERLERFSAALQPRDVIDAGWIENIAALEADCQLYRQLRAQILRDARGKALSNLLRQVASPAASRTFIEALEAGWHADDPDAVAQVEALLAQKGLTAASIDARAYLAQADKIEQLERLIASAEARRDRLIGQIYRRRDLLGVLESPRQIASSGES